MSSFKTLALISSTFGVLAYMGWSSANKISSNSTAITRLATSASFEVRCPRPAPISKIRSLSVTSAVVIIFSRTYSAMRKFCPKRFLGRIPDFLRKFLTCCLSCIFPPKPAFLKKTGFWRLKQKIAQSDSCRANDYEDR